MHTHTHTHTHLTHSLTHSHTHLLCFPAQVLLFVYVCTYACAHTHANTHTHTHTTSSQGSTQMMWHYVWWCDTMYDDVTLCMMTHTHTHTPDQVRAVPRWCDTKYDDVTLCMMMWHYVWWHTHTHTHQIKSGQYPDPPMTLSEVHQKKLPQKKISKVSAPVGLRSKYTRALTGEHFFFIYQDCRLLLKQANPLKSQYKSHYSRSLSRLL